MAPQLCEPISPPICVWLQAAGFEYLEIWASKLREFLKNNTPADLEGPVRATQSSTLEHQLDRAHHLPRLAQAYESIKQQCETLSRIASRDRLSMDRRRTGSDT